MRILHVTIGLPPYVSGGLPAYVNSLILEEKKQNHEIYILQPGNFSLGKTKIKKVKNNQFNIYSIINPLPVSSIFGIKNPQKYNIKCNKQIYLSFLKNIKVDVIHIHSIMGIHKEFFESAKELNIKLIMTSHDFFGLCLKTNFVDCNNKICDSVDYEKCSKCNLCSGLSFNKAVIIQSNIYKNIKNNNFIKKIKSKVRNKVTTKSETIEVDEKDVESYKNLILYYRDIFRFIDYFHFNSHVSKMIYEKYLGKINGEVIPITLYDIEDNRKIKKFNKILNIGYIGRKEPYKGINLLIETLEKLNDEKIAFNCYLYGDDYSSLKYDLSNVFDCGRYTRKEMNKIFEKIDVLVVPSICYETFGLIVLEALSYGVPVITTNRVGAKSLLEDYNSEIISKINSKDLSETIKQFVLNNKKLENYNKWIVNKFKFYDISSHTKEIINLYKKVIK